MASICTETPPGGQGSARATSAGCGAILLWSVLAPLSRMTALLPPLQIVAMSFAVSAVLGVALLAMRGQLGQLRQRPAAWLHGVGGLFAFHALYFASLDRAPPATANLINYTWPLLIVLLSAPVLGMRLRARHIAGTALALSGCVALLSAKAAFPTSGATSGYALAVCSALTWATYSILARRFADVPPGAIAGFCAGTAALAALTQASTEGFVAMDATAIIGIIAMGLGPVGAAFALWDVGMKRGDPRLLGTLAFATPVLSTLLLAALGYAPLTGTTIAAAALVAAGGIVATREPRTRS